MNLIANSYYSLTWVNAKYYKEKNPNEHIDETDTGKMAHIS